MPSSPWQARQGGVPPAAVPKCAMTRGIRRQRHFMPGLAYPRPTGLAFVLAPIAPTGSLGLRRFVAACNAFVSAVIFSLLRWVNAPLAARFRAQVALAVN